jgi:hypothetical protein
LDTKTFTVNQLQDAVDWLSRCNGTISITLKGKPMFQCWDKMRLPWVCKGHVITYFKNGIDVNVSRYGYREDDIKVVIHEAELDDLIADF